MWTYEVARPWADRFDASLSAILGIETHSKASFEADARRGIDGVIAPLYVAERIRNLCQYPQYGGQFTLRYRRDSGAKTEYAKLWDGDLGADIYFYGWGDPRTWEIKAYAVLHVQALRAWLVTGGREAGTVFRNPDGTEGIAFFLRQMPREVIRAWKKLPDPHQGELFTQHYTHAVIVK